MLKKSVLVFAVAALASLGSAQTVVFDTLSGTGTNFAPATSHVVTGQAFTAGNTVSLSGGQLTISAMDFWLASTASANYSNVEIAFTFFNGASLATSGSTAAFSNVVATRIFNIGALNATAGKFYKFEGMSANFSGSPVSLTGFGPHGIQVQFRGNTGSGLQITEDLTMTARRTVPTVGSNALTGSFGGVYNSVSHPSQSGTVTSMLGSDYTQGGSNTNLALRLYSPNTPVPEPTTIAALGIGALALLRRRRAR